MDDKDPATLGWTCKTLHQIASGKPHQQLHVSFTADHTAHDDCACPWPSGSAITCCKLPPLSEHSVNKRMMCRGKPALQQLYRMLRYLEDEEAEHPCLWPHGLGYLTLYQIPLLVYCGPSNTSS